MASSSKVINCMPNRLKNRSVHNGVAAVNTGHCQLAAAGLVVKPISHCACWYRAIWLAPSLVAKAAPYVKLHNRAVLVSTYIAKTMSVHWKRPSPSMAIRIIVRTHANAYWR